MHRAAGALLIAAASVAGSGCAATPAPAPAPAVRTASACGAEASLPPPLLEPLSPSEPSWGARIESVRVVGAKDVPRELLHADLGSHPGAPLNADTVAEDVRRLSRLEALDDVRVEADDRPGGVALRFVVSERLLIGHVDLVGAPNEPTGLYLPPASGELFDWVRVSSSARNLERHWRDSGHLDARARVRARRRGDTVDVCVEAERGPRFVIDRLAFAGNEALSDAVLASLIDSRDRSVNCAGAPYRRDLLEHDLLLVTARYYDTGYVNVAVGEPRVTRETVGRLSVVIPVNEGAQYRVGSVRFRGKAIGGQRALAKLFGAEPAAVFDRSEVSAGLERLRAHFAKRGRRVSVTPTSKLDDAKHLVSLVIEIEDVR